VILRTSRPLHRRSAEANVPYSCAAGRFPLKECKMKITIVLPVVLFYMGVAAQAQTTGPSAKVIRTANHISSSRSQRPQTLTGCVDEQNGHYVLRDSQSAQLIRLQSPGPDADTWFARYLGHQAQVSGSNSSAAFQVTRISQVADMCGSSPVSSAK
jgi:hypothetical protein